MWTLHINGVDVTSFVHAGATFTEVASSSDGQATFSLNGDHGIVDGQSVVMLDGSNVPMWEGTVSNLSTQANKDGTVRVSYVTAACLSSLAAVGTAVGSTSSNDVAVLASAVASATNLPWGGPSGFGVTVGGLSFTRADDALSVLSTLANASWRVQNGSICFITPNHPIVNLPTSLIGTNSPYSSVSILGGVDQASRVPLASVTPTLGPQGAPVGHASHPEIADQYTLAILAQNVGNRYSTNFSGTAIFNGATVRAGDVVRDASGVVATATTVQNQLVAGVIQTTVKTGFPPLAAAPVYSPSFSDHLHRYPVARVASDYIVSGGDASHSGLTVSISDTATVIANESTPLAAGTVSLPETGTIQIVATPNGFVGLTSLAAPIPGTGVAIARATTVDGVVTELTDLRSHGGIGTRNLKPATPAASPEVTLTDLVLTAEGTTSCVAHVEFTLSGITLDDTIRSYNVTWSIAGQNKWHPTQEIAFAPNTLDGEADVHSLSAGQGYDLGVTILGRDGIPLNANPLLLGTSPTISAAAIAIALNLDQVADGTTYTRTQAAVQTGNIPDLSKGILGKVLTNIADDATFAKTLAAVLTGNIPDLAKGILGKVMANIADDSTRSAILTSETNGSAGARTIARLNDGTIQRTAANVAAVVDASGNTPSTSALKANTPNTMAFGQTCVFQSNVVFIAPNYHLHVWIDDGAGGAPHFYNPDGTNVSPSGGSSGSPLLDYILGAANPATSPYTVWLQAYNIAGFTIVATQSAPSIPTLMAGYNDGGYMSMYASAVAGGTLNINSTGGQTPHGGNGGHLNPGL